MGRGGGHSGGVNRIFAQFCAATGIDSDSDAVNASVEVLKTGDVLPSRLCTSELAVGSVMAAAGSAARLSGARTAARHGGVSTAAWRVDPRRVEASFASDKLLRLDGHGFSVFAELSGFFRTKDGWVRTHANYPHHRARLLAAFGLDEEAGRAALSARLEQCEALEAEKLVRGRGGICVAVREQQHWLAHPQAEAVRALPLIGIEKLGAGTGAGALYGESSFNLAMKPVEGVRVLDLTRVIAGPVATRTLALLGADVLRVDNPRLPEIQWQHLDNGMGKRSTLLDLRQPTDRTTFDELLDAADVVVTGYRPGALEAFGLDAQALADRRPGLVIATVDAWGSAGPWREHRGFDSIVQAATGISVIEGVDGRPGALPAQALDHASGYMLAGAVMLALGRQAEEGGGTWHVHTHLARTAQALIELGTRDRAESAQEAAALDPSDGEVTRERETPSGRLRYALPALSPSGSRSAEDDDYPRPGGIWGADTPAWRPR